MSDDIVTRLKKMNGLLTDMEWLTVVEAAYEIERLRQLADDLYKTLQYYPCQCGLSKCKCGYDDMMNEYEEVRGE